MSRNITIRAARLDEGPLLTELSMRSKQSNGYDDAFMAACRDELTVCEEQLRDNEYWVAEAETVCGCAALSVDADARTAEVHAFFVEPDMRGTGIGSQLWDKLQDRAEALGLKSLLLDADPNAVPFYERAGFKVIGTSPSGSIPGRMIPHMRLDLGNIDATAEPE